MGLHSGPYLGHLLFRAFTPVSRVSTPSTHTSPLHKQGAEGLEVTKDILIDFLVFGTSWPCCLSLTPTRALLVVCLACRGECRLAHLQGLGLPESLRSEQPWPPLLLRLPPRQRRAPWFRARASTTWLFPKPRS